MGEQLQLARSAADEVDHGLHESILLLSDPAKSGAFLWSQWSLQRSFPTPAILWLGLMLVISIVGVSWVFLTSHLKYPQLNSFFVLLAFFKLQFYILVSDRLWISTEGAMRVPLENDVIFQLDLSLFSFVHNFQIQ